MILPVCTYYPVTIIGIIYLNTLIKSSTSKLTKKYITIYLFSIVVYTWLWILISSCLIVNKENIKLDDFAEIIGSFSGIIINLLRICDPAFWTYVRSRVVRPRRKESLARNASVYENSYIQMITQVFSTAVLKSIISLNLVMGTDHETEFGDVEWTLEHYAEKFVQEFDMKDLDVLDIPESVRYVAHRFKVSTRAHAPRVFDQIRKMIKISQEEICISFDINENLTTLKTNAGNEGGRSASFFYFSKDKKFLIKTISKSEKRFLLENVLYDYHIHIRDHPDSLLSKIIGVFTFKFQDNTKIRVMLQRNIFPNVNMVGIFDLKGSKLDRSSEGSNTGASVIKRNKIYKDLDFLSTIKHIRIEDPDKTRLKLNVYKDSEFLRQHNIIDYSLLLGISHDFNSEFKPLIGTQSDSHKYYYVGIIDYLQPYNTMKHLESIGKSIFLINVPKQDISVISPDIYSERFSRFICSIIAENVP